MHRDHDLISPSTESLLLGDICVRRLKLWCLIRASGRSVKASHVCFNNLADTVSSGGSRQTYLVSQQEISGSVTC